MHSLKKYILNIVIFFCIVAGIDFCFGEIMDKVYLSVKGGDIKEMNEVCLEKEYDVIVMGSSRAQHHYVSRIISDSLGMSCFNTGKDGQGIILMYGIFRMILNRYEPSLIIYDICGLDLLKNIEDSNNERYVSLLKPYIKQPYIGEYIRDVSFKEWLKSKSSLYRYNSISILALRNATKQNAYNGDGYSRLEGIMDYDPIVTRENTNSEIDPVKMYYFKSFIQTAMDKGIRLVCVLSPCYGNMSPNYYLPLFEVCYKNGIPVLDYFDDENFSSKKELFKDSWHLNDSGAKLFTQKMVSDLLKNI